MLVRSAFAAALWAVHAPAAALDAPDKPSLVNGVTACRDIADPALRLICYDRAAGKLADATAKQDIVVLDREDVRNTRRSLFGFTLPRSALFDDGARTVDSDDVRELKTTLKSVRAAGYGFWTMVLADGGAWQTTEASRDFEPRAGQAIRIRSGPIGGYMANIEGGRAMRVRRVG